MNKNKKLISLVIALVLSIGMIITGCGNSSSSSSSSSGIKIFYCYPTLDDFKTLLYNAIVEAAAAEGVTLDAGEPCATVDEQVAQLQEAANQGYDIIICLPLDRATALQLEASVGDLPIVFVNVQPDQDYLEKDKYVCVGSYEMDAGAYQAEYVLNALGKPSSINAVMLRGELTHNAAIQRSISVTQYMEENGIDLNYVFYDTANWDTDEAAEAFRTFLKTGQSYDAVFCNNDSMALGVVQVMKEQGIDMSKVPVVGVDATADGCASIANGEMQFTVYQAADGQAQAAIATAIAIIKEGTVENVDGVTDDGMYVWVPFEKVDASNVSNYQ